MTTVSRTLGARIHTARRKKGITSNRLAELCGVGAVHIRKIESGVKLPSIPRFIMICNALETSPQYLLQDSLDLNDSDALRLLDKLQALPPSQLALAAKHNGRVRKQHCCYDRTARKWHAGYDPMECADGYGRACRYCPVLDKELDTRRGNVFYDVKETRIIKGDWLFPDKEVTTVRKRIKALDRTVSLTLCEAIVRYAKHHIIDRFMLNHHHELYCDKSLRYELVNFRAQRQNTRDIMQDLADTAAGIAVVHQADEEKLRKEQKRARQAARQAQKVRSLEKLVLTGDLDNLTYSQRRGLGKHLSEERITELMEQRSIRAEQVQTSLFA